MLRETEKNLLINTAVVGSIVGGGFFVAHFFSHLRPHQTRQVTEQSIQPTATPGVNGTEIRLDASSPLIVGLLDCGPSKIKGFTNDRVGSKLRMSPSEESPVVRTIDSGISLPIGDVVTVRHVEGNTRFWAIVDTSDIPPGNLHSRPRTAYMRIAAAATFDDQEAALTPNKNLSQCETIVSGAVK